MSEKLLTEKEVRTVLENDPRAKDFKMKKFDTMPATKNPTGFLGEHYRMVVTIERDAKEQNFMYFVKKIPMEVPKHLEYALGTRAFYKEIEIYKTLFADLKNSQEGEDATKWRAKFYYSRASDLLVLEDLHASGFYMYPERTLMDENHIFVALKAMAAMHAATFIFEEKFNEGKVKTTSPTFQKRSGEEKVTAGQIYSHLTFETEASDVKGHVGNTYHEAGIKSQMHLVDFLAGYTDDEKKLIKEKLPDVLRQYFQMVKTSNRFKNVFVHGDLWANNILFRTDESGDLEDAVIVDFQLARYAPPAQDVMMFLHLVQNKSFREAFQEKILRSYHANLTFELRRCGLRSEDLLPWDTFLDSCRFYDDLGLIGKLFYFQLILAPPEITSKFLSSEELFTQNMLVDRSEMVVECFLKDEYCRTRMSEAMNEVIRRFILIQNKK